MYGYIKGTIIENSSNYILIDNNGIVKKMHRGAMNKTQLIDYYNQYKQFYKAIRYWIAFIYRKEVMS